MTEQFLADEVDSTGHTYPTVGENIRKGAEDLKHAIVSMLSGERFHFGFLDAEPLTSEQVTKIKTFLGIA